MPTCKPVDHCPTSPFPCNKPHLPNPCPPPLPPLPAALTLQALWLSKAHAASLAAALARCWEDQGPGAPITFTWLDWLKSSALEHLGVNTHLVVPSSGPGAGAGAAAAGGVGAGVGMGTGGAGCGPEQVAVALLRYSARREQQVFNDSNVRWVGGVGGGRGTWVGTGGEQLQIGQGGGCVSAHASWRHASSRMRAPRGLARQPTPPYVHSTMIKRQPATVPAVQAQCGLARQPTSLRTTCARRPTTNRQPYARQWRPQVPHLLRRLPGRALRAAARVRRRLLLPLPGNTPAHAAGQRGGGQPALPSTLMQEAAAAAGAAAAAHAGAFQLLTT